MTKTLTRNHESSTHVRRRQRQNMRRQAILSSALICFEREGYYNTTMSDIAKVSDISPGLIYKYFNDKQDLLFQVVLGILEDYNRYVPQSFIGLTDPLERLHAATKTYFWVVHEHMAASLLAYRETESLPPEKKKVLKQKELQTNDIISSCVRDCVDAGICLPDVNVELVTYSLITAAHAWALKHWRLRAVTDFETYTEHSFNVVLRGVLVDRDTPALKFDSKDRTARAKRAAPPAKVKNAVAKSAGKASAPNVALEDADAAQDRVAKVARKPAASARSKTGAGQVKASGKTKTVAPKSARVAAAKKPLIVPDSE